MVPGGSLTWKNSPFGHLIYVTSGSIRVGDRTLGEGSILVVEHTASATAETIGAAELYIFSLGESCVSKPSRAGGNVHCLAADDVPRCADFNGDGRVGGAVMADSSCPTCELWLHESVLHAADFDVAVHSHNEDEIIVVTAGSILLGNRECGPGTAIAVAHDTLYGFKAGTAGLTFINFRPTLPIYVPADRTQPVLNERDHYLAKMPAPLREILVPAL